MSPTKRKVKWSLIVLASCSLVLAFAYIFEIRPRFLVLPDVSDIKTMSVHIKGHDYRETTFVVEPDHFATILDALHPAERDWFSADWQGLGTISLSYSGDK